MNCGNTAHGEAKLLHEVPQQLVGRVLGALARILEAPLPISNTGPLEFSKPGASLASAAVQHPSMHHYIKGAGRPELKC